MVRSVLIVLCTLLALAASPAARAADANQASAAELEAVKGIGPALSGKILAARQKGTFKTWADLVDRVSGLGPGNAVRLSQNGLTVAGAPYAASQKPASDAVSTPSARPAKPASASAAAKAKT